MKLINLILGNLLYQFIEEVESHFCAINADISEYNWEVLEDNEELTYISIISNLLSAFIDKNLLPGTVYDYRKYVYLDGTLLIEIDYNMKTNEHIENQFKAFTKITGIKLM